jgi:DNA-binding response OmpR family regulator
MADQPTILIIEDDRTLTVALQDTLARGSLNTLTARSGEAGLAAARQHQPDLIILDLMLGKLTGIDVLRQLRQEQGWGEKVPVIILTSVTFLRNMDELKRMANKIIAKGDFDITSLADIIKRVLASPDRKPSAQ